MRVDVAQTDVASAYWYFKSRGPARINSRLAEGHKQVELGYDYNTTLQQLLEGYLLEWQHSENSCAVAGSSLMTDGHGSNIFDPAAIGDPVKCGDGDPLREDRLSFQEVSWNADQAK